MDTIIAANVRKVHNNRLMQRFPSMEAAERWIAQTHNPTDFYAVGRTGKNVRWWLAVGKLSTVEDAVPFTTLRQALSAFQEEASDLAQFEQTLPAWLYANSQAAPHPDYFWALSLGPRGGIRREAV